MFSSLFFFFILTDLHSVSEFKLETAALSIAYLQEHAAYLFQKFLDTLHGCVLLAGDIAVIVAAGFQMHDVHLLFGYPLCQIMQEQLFFQLAHEGIGGRYSFF